MNKKPSQVYQDDEKKLCIGYHLRVNEKWKFLFANLDKTQLALVNEAKAKQTKGKKCIQLN